MEARNRLRTIVENLPIVTFALDRDGVFTLSEGKGLEALGRVPGQVVGKSIFDLHRDVPAIVENIRAALSGEARFHTVQLGDVVYDSRYEPVFDTDGRPDGVVGVGLDITSLKLALDTLRSLARQLVNVQEKERGHIARELHDEIGQELTGLRFFLETARRSSDRDGDRDRDRALERGLHLLAGLMGKVHDLSLSLRPSSLDDLGLPAALRSLTWRFSSQSGIRVRFEHSGPEDRMDSDIETAAYRIVQEGLTNVARHAQTSDAAVSVRALEGTMEIVIEDQGVGFDPNAVPFDPTSVGLAGMRERVSLLGGNLAVESAPGKGTRLEVRLPVRDAAETRLS